MAPKLVFFTGMYRIYRMDEISILILFILYIPVKY